MLAALTLIHTLISLVGIATGSVVLFGLIGSKRLDRWTAWFLAATVATSVTGYFFPVHKLMPSHIVGAISLVVLAVAIYARYSRHLAGGWRTAYVVSATLALYLNVFVLVVQSFMKVPALKALAPMQQEPPFAIAQGIVFALLLVLGILAVRKFHPEPIPMTAAAAR